MNLVQELIAKQRELNPVLLYLRGTPDAPGDALTARFVDALRATGVPFAHVDIDTDSELALALQAASGDDAFPQLYIGGEYAGPPEVVVEKLREKGFREKLLGAVDRARIPASEPPHVDL